MSSILGEWREGKVRPIPGNAPHDRPVSQGIFLALEHLRRSLSTPLDFRSYQRYIPGPSVCVFQGMAESIWSDVVSKSKPNPGAGPCRLPLVGPEPR